MSSKSTPTELLVVHDLTKFNENDGRFIERVIFKNRLLVIVTCFFITIILGFQSLGLSLNAAFDKMIPTKHPYIENYLDNKDQLSGLGNNLRIAIENTEGTILTKEYLEILRQFNDDLFLMDGIEKPYMKSLWTPSTRWTGVTEFGFDGGTVIPDDYNGSKNSLKQIRLNIEKSGEIGQLVSSDFTSSIILVPLVDVDPSTGQPIDYQSLSDKLEKLRDKYQTDTIKIHITGFAKVVGDLIDGLEKILIFFAITIAICASVLFIYTRCLRTTIAVVTCSLIAVVWLLGLLPLLKFNLDPYSILVPFLIFAVGMSHGAQIMNGVMQNIGKGNHKLVASRYTFRRLFLTGVTALITDAIGFAVLMIIQIQVIQDLALIASLGVLLLMLTNLILLPVIFSFIGISTAAKERSIKAQLSDSSDIEHLRHPIWVFLDMFTRYKWAKSALIVAILMTSIGFVISMQVKIGDLDSGAPELWPDSRYNMDNQFMVDNYAASSDTYVIMVKTEEYACAKYQNLIQVDNLEFKLQQLPGVVSTSSLAGLSKISSAGMNEGSMKWYGIPVNQNLLNAIITRAPRELFNQNCDLLTIYAYLSDHKASTLDSVVNVVESFSKENNTESLTFLSAAGSAGIEAATNIVVEKANIQMLLLVYAAVSILSYITFRSFRAVICAILPLMLTSILCQALMVALGIGIKVATLPVIALGVGIGVDYALYVMSTMLLHQRNGLSIQESYYKALLSTGKMVVLTGITLGISVSTWAFSPIKFQADMGILLAFMFIFNMLGALILLPSLSYFLLKRENDKPADVK